MYKPLMGVRVVKSVLRTRLQELGWRRETLAHHVNVSSMTVQSLLSDKPVSLEVAIRVSKEVGVSLETLSPEAAKLVAAVS